LTLEIFGFRPWRTSWLIVGTETLFLSRGLLVRRPCHPAFRVSDAGRSPPNAVSAGRSTRRRPTGRGREGGV